MPELNLQQCCELSVSDKVLLDNETATTLSQQLNPQWKISLNTINENTKTIRYTFSFENYYQTIAFVNIIAQIAHQQNHHPDLLIKYKRCTVTYSTHSVGGLSKKDFICAAKINAAQNL